MDGENVVCSGQVVGVDAAGNAFGATPRRVLHNDHHVDLLRRLRQKNGEGLRASELGPSQPWTATDFDDFEARTSSQEVLYLKNSATTIKHLLEPFQKLEKGYGRNLHGFSADMENFLQRLQGVIDFLDRENEIPTRQDVIAFLEQRQAALDATSDQLHRARALHQEIIALRPSAPPSPVPSPIPAPAPSAPRREEVRSTTRKGKAKRNRT